MNRYAFRISCSFFGVLLVVGCIAMLTVQITLNTGPKGKKGIPGTAGVNEPLVPTLSSVIVPTSTDFAFTPNVTFQQNQKEKVVTASFFLTALQTIHLNPGDILPLFNLTPSPFIPLLEPITIGCIWNALDTTVQHVLYFDSSQT